MSTARLLGIRQNPRAVSNFASDERKAQVLHHTTMLGYGRGESRPNSARDGEPKWAWGGIGEGTAGASQRCTGVVAKHYPPPTSVTTSMRSPSPTTTVP